MSECEIITRNQVPNCPEGIPPSPVRGHVIDRGRERWRFNDKGDLVVYIKYHYRKGDLESAEQSDKFPWERLWSAPGW